MHSCPNGSSGDSGPSALDLGLAGRTSLPLARNARRARATRRRRFGNRAQTIKHDHSARFSSDNYGQFSAHCFYVLAQCRKQQVRTLLQLSYSVLSDIENARHFLLGLDQRSADLRQ